MKHGRIGQDYQRLVSTLRRRIPGLVAMALAVAVVVHADSAFAQADPFATAKEKANEVQQSLQTFATSVGMIGIVCCLLLGYFNKLNWRWLATGIGVSFAIGTVPGFVRSLAGLAG